MSVWIACTDSRSHKWSKNKVLLGISLHCIVPNTNTIAKKIYGNIKGLFHCFLKGHCHDIFA